VYFLQHFFFVAAASPNLAVRRPLVDNEREILRERNACRALRRYF
jgi:hypothetical protein